jgi:hypothetical protein
MRTVARALFAAPAARRALLDGRSGTVELVLRRGSYLRFGEDWVALVESGAPPFGPLSVAVHGITELGLTPGVQACVGGGALTVGGAGVSLRRMRERRMAHLSGPRSVSQAAVAGAAAAARSALRSAPSALRPGIDAIAAGSPVDAVNLLAGLGEGLTPAGDDVLAGYAAWRAATGAREAALLRAAAERCSPLGLAYLRCAERGELPDACAPLVVAIRHGSVPAVQAAIKGLGAWGASSGTAFGWGVVAATAGFG